MLCFKFPSSSIESTFEGYQIFIELYDKVKDLIFDEIILDFKELKWFDANLTAILGAILNNMQANINEVRIENLSPDIEKIFERNYFLSYFGGKKITDFYNTTIGYKKFKPTDEKFFQQLLCLICRIYCKKK